MTCQKLSRLIYLSTRSTIKRDIDSFFWKIVPFGKPRHRALNLYTHQKISNYVQVTLDTPPVDICLNFVKELYEEIWSICLPFSLSVYFTAFLMKASQIEPTVFFHSIAVPGSIHCWARKTVSFYQIILLLVVVVCQLFSLTYIYHQ